MAKQLLREYYELCPDGICKLEYLNEAERVSLSSGGSYLTGVCQRAGVKNGNGRIYSKEILMREVERYQHPIKARAAAACGELDHSNESVIALRGSSHVCTGLWWEGNDLIGKFEILSGPSGQTLRSLVKDRIKLGISSRGLGSLRESREGSIVEEDFQLICFDIVSEPSTTGAYVLPDNSGLAEALKRKPTILGVDDLIESILRR